EPTGDSADINLTLKVQEKQTGTASAGAGYSSQSGLTGFVELGHNNLFGNGQNVNIRLERGGRRNDLQLSFTEPWFRDTPLSIGSDIFNTRRYPVRRGAGAQDPADQGGRGRSPGRGGVVLQGDVREQDPRPPRRSLCAHAPREDRIPRGRAGPRLRALPARRDYRRLPTGLSGLPRRSPGQRDPNPANGRCPGPLPGGQDDARGDQRASISNSGPTPRPVLLRGREYLELDAGFGPW